MNEANTISRGDIYLYDFGENPGSIQCGKRPVLVIQSDNSNRTAPTTIIAAITTVIKKQYLASHILLPEDIGLEQPSMLLLEQIKTVNKEDLGKYLGSLRDDKIWKQVNNGMKKVFGLWFYKDKNTANIRCLCSKCVRDYMDCPDYIVKRLDPFAKTKDRCTKCNNPGYDYLIFDRRQNH